MCARRRSWGLLRRTANNCFGLLGLATVELTEETIDRALPARAKRELRLLVRFDMLEFYVDDALFHVFGGLPETELEFGIYGKYHSVNARELNF